MHPHVVFDCQKVVPNRFLLTLAAAARSRALGLGATPRLDLDDADGKEIALHEIASGVFTADELALFLPNTSETLILPARAARLRVGQPPPQLCPPPVTGDGSLMIKRNEELR